MPPFIPSEPRTSRRAWAFLALLPLIPLLALNGLAFVLDMLGFTVGSVASAVVLLFGLLAVFGWLLLLGPWVVALAAWLAIKSRSMKPLLLAVPSLGFVVFVAVG